MVAYQPTHCCARWLRKVTTVETVTARTEDTVAPGGSIDDRGGAVRRPRLGIRYVVTILALLAASSCGEGHRPPSANGPDSPGASPGPTATQTGNDDVPTVISAGDFHKQHFTESTSIDNHWLPLEPGTRLVFEGAANDDDGVRHPTRDVFIVTDLTKTVDGVRTVVVWDRDYSNGSLVEAELALFAQDDSGNVWLLGEYPEEYEAGEIVDAPTWISGLQRARAGVAMPAVPGRGTPSYAAGWAPAVEFTDRSRVSRVGRHTCVPAGCFDDVVVIDEFNPDEPGSHQLKYYAPGNGNVRVGWSGAKDEAKEVLTLIERSTLSTEEVAAARAGALALEESGFRLSPHVYAMTERSMPLT